MVGHDHDVGKARTPRHRVVDHFFLHEGAAAALDAYQTVATQRRHRTTQRVAVHTEALRQFGLRGQALRGVQDALPHLLDERPVDLPPLAVRNLGGFLALALQEACPELCRLAEDCVRECDDLRAPPTAPELAQRRQRGLSPRQDALLARWGYPYVFEEFRFHLTLTGRPQPAEADALLGTLQNWFAPALTQPRRVEGVALYHQASPEAAFRLVERIPFAV